MKKLLSLFTVSLLFAVNVLSDPALTKEVEKINKFSVMRAKAFQTVDPRALSEIIEKTPNADDRNSAKVLLMLYFSVKGDSDMSASDRESSKKFRDDLVKNVPNSWQGMYAKVCALCEMRSQSTDNDASHAIRLALKEWDFDVLEKESSPTFQAIRKVYGDRPNVIRECLKFVLVNCLCLTRSPEKIDEAEKVKSTITDEIFLKEAEGRILNARAVIEEKTRLKVARERAVVEGKPWPDGQAPINVLVDKENQGTSTNNLIPQTEKKD
jgi:hypothetical protein